MQEAEKKIADLPHDVLLRILTKVSIEDIRECRQVCTLWRTVLDDNKSETLELLPHDDRSVLGYFADKLGNTVAGIAQVLVGTRWIHYHRYFLRWRDHICPNCQPADLVYERDCYYCREPDEFQFVSVLALRPSPTIPDAPVFRLLDEFFPNENILPLEDVPIYEHPYFRRPVLTGFIRIPYSYEFCCELVRLDDIREVACITIRRPNADLLMAHVLERFHFVLH